MPDEPLLPDEPLPLEESPPPEELELLPPEDPEPFLLVPAFDLAFLVAPPSEPPPLSEPPDALLPPCVPVVPEPPCPDPELPVVPVRLAPPAPPAPDVPPTMPMSASTSQRTTVFVALSSVPFSTTYSITSP